MLGGSRGHWPCLPAAWGCEPRLKKRWLRAKRTAAGGEVFALGDNHLTRRVVEWVPAVLAPFAHVAMHIEQSQPVRAQQADWPRAILRTRVEPTVAIEQFDRIAKAIS